MSNEPSSHYLRPQFTTNLIKTLQQGTSVNLVAPTGQGRKRLLEEIANTRLDNTQILLVDMENYKENYAGFLCECWQQLGKKGEFPTDLTHLMTLLEETRKKYILLLYHFDYLLNNARLDPKFNVTFFNNLNAIQAQKNISLLCVTKRPHDQDIIFVEDKSPCNSWLNLEKKRLPKLNYDEIQYELKTRNLSLSLDELSAIAWFVSRNDKPYFVLDYFTDKLKNRDDDELELARRLRKWDKQFKKEGFILTTRHMFQSKKEIKTWFFVTKTGRIFPLLLGYIVDFINNHFLSLKTILSNVLKARPNDKNSENKTPK
jgi:hypothetical protein